MQHRGQCSVGHRLMGELAGNLMRTTVTPHVPTPGITLKDYRQSQNT
jgi:hypothetical protein